VVEVKIDLPEGFDIVKKKNILLMAIILATLINRLTQTTGYEDLSDEEIKSVLELDSIVKEDIFKHYTDG